MDENTGKKLTALGGIDLIAVTGTEAQEIGKADGGGNDTKSGTPDVQRNIEKEFENFLKISEAKNEQNLKDEFF